MAADSTPLEIDVQPGFFKAGTSQAARGRYIDGNFIHFKSGKPEKWLGWMKSISTALLGYGRGGLGWIDSVGTRMLLIGTAFKAYAYTDVLTDITPYRAVNPTGTLGNNPFTTTNGSPIVSVAHTTHNVIPDQHVHFAGATAVNGVTMNGEWTVLDVTNANAYRVTYSGNANNSGAGGGAAVTFAYEIPPSPQSSAAGLGVGVGVVGEGTVGTPRTAPATPIIIDLRTWFFSRYGNEIMCVPSGDTIFLWDEPNADPRPLPLAGAPTTVYAFFVTAERFPVALGTELGRMVMQWADVDTLSWDPDITNQANGRQLQYGTRLVAGCVTGDKVNVFWSDTAFYGMNYNGGPFIYDTPVIATEAGLYGPDAFTETPLGVMWLSGHDFFMYSGQIGYIPNRMDIREFVHLSLNDEQSDKTTCDYDAHHNSVIWSVCFEGEDEPGHWIEVVLDDFSWTTGTWNGGIRTAIISLGGPDHALWMIGDDAAGVNGYIYDHNVGYDADGIAMPWFITHGVVGLNSGDIDAEIEYFEPDYERQTGTVTLEIKALDRPMSDWYLQEESFSIPQGTGLLHLNPVVGGRYMTMTERGESIGGDWRAGLSKVWIATGGDAEA